MKSFCHRGSLPVLALLALPLFVASPALAADPAPAAPAAPAPTPEATAEAARQSDLARHAVKAKRFLHAAELFEAAAALNRQASTNVSAGVAWDQADRPDRAADAYARALLANEPDASGKDRLETLERSLGTVDIKAPPGWTVQLDGGSEAATPARLHSTPGVHSLAISAPDRPITRRDVRLEVGKPLALTLKDEPVAPVTADKPREAPSPTTQAAPTTTNTRVIERAPPGQTRRAIGFTLAGLGLATLGGAALLGVQTVNARDAFNDAPSQSLYDHEQALQTWTNVALVAGSVFVVGGVALVLWPSGSSSTEVSVGVAPSPGGGSFVGRF